MSQTKEAKKKILDMHPENEVKNEPKLNIHGKG